METITAEQAKKITAENLKGPAIESFVSTLTVKIRLLASAGKSSFDPWGYIATLRGSYPTIEEKDAIRKHFEAAGFKWQEHPNPDPGHPASRAYTTISW